MFDFALGMTILVIGSLLILSIVAMIVIKPVKYFLEIEFQVRFGSLFEGIKINQG
jgi:hypothetical protein